MDEPTSGLDPIGAAEFDELIATLRDTLGLTVYMVTHDLDSLFAVCDRIAVLAEKRVLVEGDIATMLASEHEWVQSYFRGKKGTTNRSDGTGSCGGPQGEYLMETRANYVAVGAFTMLVLLASFAFIYWVATLDGSVAQRTINVRIAGVVSGLTPNSEVHFNGIKVGQSRPRHL